VCSSENHQTNNMPKFILFEYEVDVKWCRAQNRTTYKDLRCIRLLDSKQTLSFICLITSFKSYIYTLTLKGFLFKCFQRYGGHVNLGTWKICNVNLYQTIRQRNWGWTRTKIFNFSSSLTSIILNLCKLIFFFKPFNLYPKFDFYVQLFFNFIKKIIWYIIQKIETSSKIYPFFVVFLIGGQNEMNNGSILILRAKKVQKTKTFFITTNTIYNEWNFHAKSWLNS